ncbi:MAG: VWA domain-containing protein [Hyphomicrobiaceae bacterium]|nr:VWA domain-containing protein [Hyphomicrobiaceae bacterium]
MTALGCPSCLRWLARQLPLRALLLLSLVLGGAAARAQPPETGPSAFIVLDGSGSMAAPLGATRVPKLGLAREAIGRALPRLPAEFRLGLSAFGHRRGECTDTETLRQAERIDPARMSQLLERVSPRGRGPVSLALRMAAREMSENRGPRSLVLIHDDADNCAVDLCTLAAELGRAGVKVYAIGLALKPEDRPKMACLPELTGGKLFLPTTPEQVAFAVEEALQLAAAGGVARPPQPAPVLEGLDAQAAVPETAPPGLYLRARLSGQAPDILRQPLNWTVVPEGDGKVPAFSGISLNPMLALPAGRYLVEVRDGPVRASAPVTVAESKPTVLIVSLDAGALRVRVATARGSLALANTHVGIARLPAAEPALAAPPGDVVSAFAGTDGTLLLPAGRYLVRAETGLVRSQRTIEVKAGGSEVVGLVLEAGLLQLSAGTLSTSGPAVFAVLEDDPDAPRGRREVLRTAQRAPEIAVPPGTYTVELRQAGIEARERVVVASGEAVRRALNLPAAQVALSTRLGSQVLSNNVFYSIERIDAAGADMTTTTSRPQPTLLLAAGRYRIESRLGPINARAAREVEVRAGAAPQQIVFDQSAATLLLRAQNAPGEVFWDLRDARGSSVWSTGQPEPELTLQAGQYLIRAFARDRQVERPLDLRAGERRSLDVSFE